MQWIKATERLPKSGDEVFIKIEGTRSIGAYKKHHDLFMNVSGDFFPADQVEWLDESSDWIDADVQAPQLMQDVAFIVESKNPMYNGRLLGGRYQGNQYGYHEFSVPGMSFSAKLWQPLPSTPQGGDKK